MAGWFKVEMPTFDRTHVDQLLANAAWVKRLAIQLVGDRHLAEDVVQETWLAALENPPKGVQGRWLYRVTHNLAAKKHRSNQRRSRREQYRYQTSDEAVSGEEVVSRAEVHRELADAVLQMPEPYRTTVFLRYFEELKPEAIAVRQGISPHTVRTRLQRGIQQLRNQVEKRLGEDWRVHCLLLCSPPGSVLTSTTTGVSTVFATSLFYAIMNTKALLTVAGCLLAVTAAVLFFQGQNDQPPDSMNASEEFSAVAGTEVLNDIEEAEHEKEEERTRLETEPPLTSHAIGSGAQVTMRIRALDSQGLPVVGLPLQVQYRLPRAASKIPGVVITEVNKDEPGWLLALRGAQLQTDAEGFLEYQGILDPEDFFYCHLGGQKWVRETLVIRDWKGKKQLDLGTIVLHQGFRYAGFVVNAQGIPASGAKVRVMGSQKRPWEDRNAGREVVEALTDENGRFETEAVPPGTYPLTLAGPHHVEHEAGLFDVKASSSRNLQLQLQSTEKTTIRIFDENSNPAPNVLLRIRRLANPGRSNYNYTDHLMLMEVTDDAGEYWFEGIAAGEGFSLNIVLDGYSKINEVLTAGSEHEIRLTRSQGLEVEVQDAAGRKAPLSIVFLQNSQGKTIKMSLADKEGFVVFKPLAVDTYSVTLGPQESSLAEAEDIRVNSAEESPRKVLLRPALESSITVTLVTPQGQTLEDYSVSLLPEKEPYGLFPSPLSATEVDDKRFIFRNLPPRKYEVSANLGQGWAALPVEVQQRLGEANEVQLQVYQAGKLQVRLRDHMRQPMANTGILLQGLGVSGQPAGIQKQKTDTNGFATWESLPPGRYWIAPQTIWWDFFQKQEGPFDVDDRIPDARWIELQSGDVKQAQLDLQQCASLTVEVFRGEIPLKNVKVGLTRGWQQQAVETTSIGEAQFEPLKPGEARIEVKVGEGAFPQKQAIELTAGVNTVRFDLEGSALRGQVRLEGKPLALARVWLVPESESVVPPDWPKQVGFSYMGARMVPFHGEGAACYTNPQGEYELTHLPPGNYRLEVRHVGATPWFQSGISIPENSVETMPEITLSQGGQLRLNFGEQGIPSVYSLKLLLDGKRAMWASCSMDRDNGACIYEGLSPGIYSVHHEGVVQTVEVSPTQVAFLDFGTDH